MSAQAPMRLDSRIVIDYNNPETRDVRDGLMATLVQRDDFGMLPDLEQELGQSAFGGNDGSSAQANATQFVWAMSGCAAFHKLPLENNTNIH